MNSLLQSNDYISKLNNLSLASYLHEQQIEIKMEENGFWINTFNVINPVIPEDGNIYPFTLYNDKILPEIFNTITQFKMTNKIETIECNDKIFYNFIHYRFIPLDYFNKKNNDYYLRFLNQDLID